MEDLLKRDGGTSDEKIEALAPYLLQPDMDIFLEITIFKKYINNINLK